MGTQIFEQDDDSLVLVTEQESPVVIESASVNTVITADPFQNLVRPIVDGRGFVVTGGPVQEVVEVTRGREYFRGIVNYDGGFPGTHYGDLMGLDGGGVTNAHYFPL
jgi:hypothetical protein